MGPFGDFLRTRRARLGGGPRPDDDVPSAQTIDAIRRVLRWGPGVRPDRIAPAGQEVGPELLRLMNAFPHAAAYVVNPALRVLAANPTAAALIGRRQQALPYLFLDPEARRYFVEWDVVARAAVSALRPATGHPEVAGLVARLARESPAFGVLWDDRAVAGVTATRKLIDHPDVGRIALTHQTLDVLDSPGQQLVVATAPRGSPSADALTLLGLTGH